MRDQKKKCGLFVLVIAVLVAPSVPVMGAERSKNKSSSIANSAEVPRTPSGKIDLLRADPSQVDLAKVDPSEIELSKEIVKKLDLSKWDLTKIDTSKVDDALAAKWIQKRIKEEASLEKTLGSYKPGELERIQEENVKKWLREPAPLNETEPSRSLKLSQAEVERRAKAIDEIVLDKLRETKQAFNPLTSDEQFVRRIYVNIAGRIPTAREAEAFLSDKNPKKREQLINSLLLSVDYPSQMFNWVADMMRVRELKSNQGETWAYQAWLLDQLKGNRPWNKMVYDLLTAEGDLVTQPAVGWLVRDDGMPLDSLSNTLTTFMGANVSCAQCHDHPFNDYTQKDFYELAAFFGSTDVPGKNTRGAPKILKNRYHYVKTVPDKFLAFPKDYKYPNAKPESRVTPAFPMLKEMAARTLGSSSDPLGRKDFANWMTNKQNEQFAATIANRLWGKALGIPVMVPVTEMDNLSLADNPKLIKALAALMQELDFDLMAFQRVIYNTRAFQSQASISPEVGEPYRFQGPALRRMTAEETWDSLVTLVKGEDINDYQRERKALLWSYNVFKDGFLEHHANVKNKIEDDKVISEAAKMSSRLLSERRDGHARRSGKSKHEDADVTFARASELSQPEADAHFLRQFGQSERELANDSTTEGGIPQSLMLMNGSVSEMLARPSSYVMTLAQKATTEDGKLDVMYMSFLSRKPTSMERNLIVNEKIGLSKLTWILMNTREFMFVQ